MKQYIFQTLRNWMQSATGHNPVITEPKTYLPKVATALQVGLLAAAIVIVFAIILWVGFVLAVIKGWV